MTNFSNNIFYTTLSVCNLANMIRHTVACAECQFCHEPAVVSVATVVVGPP